MKQIIHGKKYDTATAKELGTYSNDGNWRDFNHFEESLYLKRTGEFFLAGEGGPMTKYAYHSGNTSYGSENIIPLTIDQAKAWAEKHLSVDEYEEIFGEVEE